MLAWSISMDSGACLCASLLSTPCKCRSLLGTIFSDQKECLACRAFNHVPSFLNKFWIISIFNFSCYQFKLIYVFSFSFEFKIKMFSVATSEFMLNLPPKLGWKLYVEFHVSVHVICTIAMPKIYTEVFMVIVEANAMFLNGWKQSQTIKTESIVGFYTCVHSWLSVLMAACGKPETTQRRFEAILYAVTQQNPHQQPKHPGPWPLIQVHFYWTLCTKTQKHELEYAVRRLRCLIA